jgi:Ala-tRNA(Pro) deacylase
MPATRTDLFERLDRLGIPHSTTEHAPIFTVEEGRAIKTSLPGGHTKNLFLKDKRGQLVLISALGDSVIPVNRLHKHLDCGRLSFGREELLIETLGVRGGSVTAFALINDTDVRVRFIVDAALMEHETVNFHPLSNDATTNIHSSDLLRFAQDTGHAAEILDFRALIEDSAGAQ